MKNTDERLRDIEVAVASLTAKVDEILSNLVTKVNNHDYVINGNGTDGLRVKIEKVLDRNENQRWHFRAIWTLLLGIAARVVYTLIK